MNTQDGYPNLVPLDRDPELSRQQIKEDRIRDALQTLRDIDNPYDAECAYQIELLHRSWAARGREVDRMQSLVLEVMSGEAQRGLQDEIDLLQDRLRGLAQKNEGLRAAHHEEAVRVGEQRTKDEARRRRTADAARRHYGAWLSACARLESQAQTIRTLSAEVRRLQDGRLSVSGAPVDPVVEPLDLAGPEIRQVLDLLYRNDTRSPEYRQAISTVERLAGRCLRAERQLSEAVDAMTELRKVDPRDGQCPICEGQGCERCSARFLSPAQQRAAANPHRCSSVHCPGDHVTASEVCWDKVQA